MHESLRSVHTSTHVYSHCISIVRAEKNYDKGREELSGTTAIDKSKYSTATVTKPTARHQEPQNLHGRTAGAAAL